MTISPSERILAEIDGPIGWLTVNNPERRNALSPDMLEAIPIVVEHFERDPKVRVIVVKGAGDKAFISGADISKFEEQRSSPETVARWDAISARAAAALGDATKPVIAMIRGYCIGGGVGYALRCDLRIAAEGSKFGIPAARLGLGYQWPVLKMVVDLVGPGNAKEILLTARQFTAAEAKEMGLINRVVPEAELESAVRAICAMIADNAPLTMAAVKGIIRELGKPPGAFDRARCDALAAGCFASADYVEGRRAFMEKRKPVFAGK
jgi:enoyl-CoA hydratase